LKLKVNQNHTKGNLNKDFDDILIMPKKSIIPKKNLKILKAFREFFAYKSISKKEIDLGLFKSNIVKTFLTCYDCPDINSDLS